MFCANEHEPVHVHGKYQGHEAKAEIVMIDGTVETILFMPVTGRPCLPAAQLKFFQELVTLRAEDTVQKWIDFFVLNKPVQPETIHRRLK